MMKLHPPKKVEVRKTPNKGFGVFATEHISKGELIEECHLITLPIPTCMEDILDDYRFNYPQGPNPTHQVLPLGFGCIYNHDSNNNAYWENHLNEKVFRYIAKRDIEVGEEVCTYYGNVEFP